MKKIIIVGFVMSVSVSIGIFFILQKRSVPPPVSKCGDNICDEFEKRSPYLCPKDCVSLPSVFNRSSLDSPFGMLPFFSFDKSLREGPPPKPEHFDFKPTEDLGLKWGRAHYLIWSMVQPTKNDVDKERYDWSDSDSVLGSYPEGFNAVENIIAFSAKVDDEGEHLDNFSFPNKEAEEEYIRFVKKGVERYDGDGKDDMPGLKNPIKYWQVENEPDLKAKKDWSGYANLLKITYEGIKSVCADCQVIIGGMGGEMRGLNEFFKPALEKLGGKYFDIFDYHCYGSKEDWYKCGRLAEEIKMAFPDNNFEIWLTETGTWSGNHNDPSGQPSKIQTEEDQAKALVKFYVYPLSRGVKKVFWAWGILEGFGGPENNIFDKTGLMYDGYYSDDLGFGVKKLSYYTYKKMVEMLEGSEWDTIETITEKNDMYAYKFLRGGKTVWIAWNDSDSEKEVVIEDIGSQEVKITEAVANCDSGKEVKDRSTAFSTKTEGIKNGKIMLKIKDIPVFVEEI